MKRGYLRYSLIGIFIICVSALLISCGTGSGDDDVVVVVPGVGTTASITLTADPESIPADGSSSSAITATLKDSVGAAVNTGTSITFSTTLGTFPNGITSYPVTTPDDTGSVTVSLKARTTPGTTLVVAASNGITQGTEVVFTSLSVPSAITLTADPDNMPADGNSRSIISARVTDDQGNPAPDNERINFNIISGSGGLPYYTSDWEYTAGGMASVTYESSTTPGTVTIQASAAKNPAASGTVNITLIETVGDIILTATPNELLADGSSESTITAMVTDGNGDPVPDNERINFNIISGTGGLPYSTSDWGYTLAGMASKTYRASTTPGTVTIQASAAGGGAATSATVNITLIETVAELTITATPNELLADGSSESTITAMVTDGNGDPVPDYERINFNIISGTGGLPYSTSDWEYTLAGMASVTYRASTTPGTVTIQASAAKNPAASATVNITLIDAGLGSMSLTASPDTITANGSSSSAITATLKDRSGSAVPKGTSVTFSTTLGTFTNGSTMYMVTTPDDSGTVTVSLISGVTPGNAIVTASSGGISQTATVEFTTDPAGPGSTASITLTAEPDTIQANGSSSSAITATLTDSTRSPVATGTTVTFATTLGTMSRYLVQTPDDTGTVTVSLISGTTPGNATVTAMSGGISQTVIVMFTGEDVPATPSSLSLSLSQASVKSDNSDSSTVTAMVLDSNNAVITGIAVTFSSDGGQLSAAIVETDENGEAKVVFSSGTTDKSNRVVLITATVSGLTPRQIPVQVTGTTLSLSTDTTNLEIGGQNQATLTIIARDAGLVPIYDAQVTITANPPNRVQLNPPTGNTDVGGKLEVTVTGTQPGDVTVQVAALGATATQNYTVGAVGAVFTIIHPTTDPYSWHTEAALATTGPLFNVFSFNDNAPPAQDTITRAGGDFTVDGFAVDDEIMVVGSQFNDGVYTIANIPGVAPFTTLELVESDSLTTEAAAPGFTVIITNGVLVRVNAPNQNQVEFATTLGVWDGVPGDMVVTRPVNLATNEAEAILSSNEAGVANILVSDAADPSTQDTLVVTFSAPSSTASQISLQASFTVVAPSVGGVTNSVTLTATVKNATDQVVGGAPVAFSIENPTGGGEYVSPPIVYTDDFGIAESTFTSGSLSSDAQGVTVRASLVINPAITDTIAIVIGGTAGSVVIGRSTSIYSINNDTAYELPMSVLVSDSNGNPMTNTIVSLSAWPSHYQRGVWAEDPVTGECSLFYWGAAAGATTGPSTVIAFIDANPDTITRTAGSFIIDGFVSGDYIWVTGSLSNDGYYTISTVAAATLTLVAIDTLIAEGAGASVTITAVGWISNEDDFWVGTDMYRNLILDPGEDANMDGQLTPPNSAAGSVPATVITDDNGVGTFSLIYLKSSAAWIEDEITASTLVYGTETQGTYIFVLPYSQQDADDCVLPNSPYN